MQLTPELRKKIGMGLLLSGVGLVLFVVFLVLTFPTEKSKLFIQKYASYYLNRNLTIETMSVFPPLRASFREARIRGKRGKPDLVVDRLAISLSPLSLILSPYKLSGSASLLNGDLRFRVWLPKPVSEQIDLEFSGRRLDLSRIPAPSDGLPIRFSGYLDLSGNLVTFKNNIKSWRGRLNLSIQEGLIEINPEIAVPIPSLSFNRMEGELILQKGVMTTQNLVLQGGDVDAVLEGRIILENPIEFSRVTALFRFRLLSKDKAIRLKPLLSLLRQDPEGYYNVPIQGSFAEFGGNIRALYQFSRARNAR